jgi:hypothetical protein
MSSLRIKAGQPSESARISMTTSGQAHENFVRASSDKLAIRSVDIHEASGVRAHDKTAVGITFERSLRLIAIETFDGVVVVELRYGANDDRHVRAASFPTTVLVVA